MFFCVAAAVAEIVGHSFIVGDVAVQVVFVEEFDDEWDFVWE
ncbi:hypothetical protein [Rossellomorea aquimaris]|nr:hypothetical protein [Rossellomorea aquimaris]